MIKISAYPRTVTLPQGDVVTLRPLNSDDEARLLDFFLTIPEEERWYLKQDITSPGVVFLWTHEIDYKRILPLLAFTEAGQIVGDAVLIRRRGGARSHIAEIRVLVSPQFRHRGLAAQMIRDLCDIADDAGIELVVTEIVDDAQDEAMALLELAGFNRVSTLEGMAKDQQGHSKDVVVLSLPLGRYYKWSKLSYPNDQRESDLSPPG